MHTALNWDKEYVAVKKLKNKIINALINKMPSSLPQEIMLHHTNAGIENHTIKNVKTYWMIAYDMKRMSDRITNKEHKTLINNFKNECCSSTCTTLNGERIDTAYHPLELWAFAARWAELEYRTNNKKIHINYETGLQ